IAIRKPGDPNVLTPELRPVPRPAAHEVLVKVAAVNRPDVMQRMGLYPPPQGATDIPGLEIAGEVAACGAGVTPWQNGDLVMALVVGGGYAQYCLAHGHALPVPQPFRPSRRPQFRKRFLPCVTTSSSAGGLKAGETLLVHADRPPSAPPQSNSPRLSAPVSS